MGAGSSSETTFTKPSDREVVITHVFDAPRELVFKTMTDPDLVPKWWGPRRQTTVVDTMDARPGGKWRFVSRDEDGNEFAFRGEYREIVPPERLAYTFEFEGLPGHVSLETVTFEEHDGKTTVTNTALFDTTEDRDGLFESGMQSGATETMDRLGELLASLV
jgi:uncharacterized protein YndB with AHSA1/START domain